MLQAVFSNGEAGEGVEDFLPLGRKRIVEAELGVDVDEGLGGPAQQADGEVTVFIPGAGVFGRPGVWEVKHAINGLGLVVGEPVDVAVHDLAQQWEELLAQALIIGGELARGASSCA